MFLQWISESNLGFFSIDRNFTVLPIKLQYVTEYPTTTASIHEGRLPDGLSIQSFPNYVYIVGTATANTMAEVYAFTIRLTAADGTTLDREFILQMIGTVPAWTSAGNLGVYTETYSFGLTPLVLDFAADQSAKLTLINGALPAGLNYTKNNSNIVITGESLGIDSTLKGSWTFRLTNPNGNIADRTFTLTITPEPVAPSWQGQKTFLGYVGAGTSNVFHVAARYPGTVPPTYSILAPVPAGMSIDGLTGEITYAAPDDAAESVTSFTVRATLPTGSSDLFVSIEVLSVPHAPVWIEPFETLSVPQKTYLESYLKAYDPRGAVITYSIYAIDGSDPSLSDFPFILDPQGLLYGPAPEVLVTKSWQVVLAANTEDGTGYNTITLDVTKTNAPGVLTWRNSQSEILGITDGCRAVFDIGANSTRTPTVRHGITGGQVPVGLVLDKVQGQLVGYVEYHAADKDYWFDITATDGLDVITRTIHMQVIAAHDYQFGEVSVPMWGDAKQRWLANNHLVLDNSVSVPNVSVESSLYQYPSMSLIKGLDSTLMDPDQIIHSLAPSLQEMRLTIGPFSNVTVDQHGNQLIYRSVIDPQSGAAFEAAHPNGAPSELRPPSLEGLRTALIQGFGLASNAEGSGASAVPTIDPEQGVITDVKVMFSGSGYRRPPSVTVIGSGKGAKLACTLRVVNVRVIDRGQGWELGEQIFLDTGLNSRPAELIVSAVDINGGLLGLFIVDGGSYSKVPRIKIQICNAAGKLSAIDLIFGVDAVQVISGGKGYKAADPVSVPTVITPVPDTEIFLTGTEMLETWQEEWQPILPMSVVTGDRIRRVLANERAVFAARELDGVQWQVGDLIYSVQGIYWQGTTTFDDGLTTWGGDTTRFEETIEPRDLIIDSGDTSFDEMFTTFDVGPAIRPDARLNWGRTLIDDGTTAFDFYATIFDVPAAPTESSTVVRKLIRVWKPQLTGNNNTDWN